jgi:hypothetical protein
MLQQLVPINFNFKHFHRIVHNVVCDTFNCQVACLVHLWGVRTKVAQTETSWASVTGHPPLRGFSIYECSQSVQTIFITCKSSFCIGQSSMGINYKVSQGQIGRAVMLQEEEEIIIFLRLPSKHVWHLLCTVTADLDLWSHSTLLIFPTWEPTSTTVSVVLQVERFWYLNSMNYRPDNITHSNVYSFHSSACQFTNSVTVKWYIFHVYILYFTGHKSSATNLQCTLEPLHFSH